MFDWITLSVETVGFVILMVWVVVPIREFRGIFKRLKEEERSIGAEPIGGFEVIPQPKNPDDSAKEDE